MTDRTQPPERPNLHYWIALSGTTVSAFARRLGMPDQQLRAYLLPYGERLRKRPGETIMARIMEATGGEITCVDWYPASLGGRRLTFASLNPPASVVASAKPADEDYHRKDFAQAGAE